MSAPISLRCHELRVWCDSNAKRTLENTSAADIEMTETDVQQVWVVINSTEVKGDRYFGTDPKAVHLWG